MKKNQKILVIIGIIVVISTISFLIIRKRARAKSLAGAYDGLGAQPAPAPASTVSDFFYPLPESPFKTASDIKAFQLFVINVKNDKKILGKYLDDGKWGRNTSKAFDKYGSDFQKSLKPPAGENSPTAASTENMKSSYDSSWYVAQANKLFSYWDGVTNPAATVAAQNILLSLKTDTDWYKLYNAFGVRNTWDLRKWIDWEQSNVMVKELNKNWKSKGMTRQLSQNPNVVSAFFNNF